MKYVWIYIGAIALIDAIAGVVFVSAPSDGLVRGYFVSEDSLIENLTASFYLLTCLFALVLLNIRSTRTMRGRKALMLFSVFGLIAFLEELSYGERLFDIEMPVLSGMKIDAVHDFFSLGLDLTLSLAAVNQLLIFLGFLTVLVLSAAAIFMYGKRHWEAAVAHQFYPAYLMALFFVVLIIFSLIIDTGLFEFPGFRALEECLELNAALALLMSCFLTYKLGADRLPRS